MRKRILPISILIILPFLCLLGIAVFNLRPVHDRLAWRLEGLITTVRHRINPPAEAVFVPQEAAQLPAEVQVAAIVEATLSAFTTTQTAVAQQPPAAAAVSLALPTPSLPTAAPPSPTPTLSPTPIPGQVVLSGARHEYQQMNNCGPTTLAMALSYWGWQGDQRDTRAVLRPNFNQYDDKNVMPAEMAAYVEQETGLKALARFGGDLDLLKRLVAAGFPVIIEKGFQPPKEEWMGHFELVTGYDDARGRLITQDSYIMADFPVPYEEVTQAWWRDFNYAYVIVFPPEREAEALGILGIQADAAANYRWAAEKASQEIEGLNGRDRFFALYNLGSSLAGLEDWVGAAEAYDRAFALYPDIPSGDRPWRMLWYQVGPYEAYYHTGRYGDLIALGNQTLSFLNKPVLEETYYWLGKAREAQGELEKAIEDYKQAVDIHPASTPAREELLRLGVEYP